MAAVSVKRSILNTTVSLTNTTVSLLVPVKKANGIFIAFDKPGES